MKNILKKILSMEVMIILLLLFALVCAVATFIENDFGVIGSKSFIYGQKWFEVIMLILTTGIIAHIFWFKMYKKSKLFILLIHISLVLIFIGAALTRYYGFEATMTINEGQMSNKIDSIDEYIQVKINGKTYEDLDEKALISELSQSSYSKELILNNSTLKITLKDYIKNAVEKIVPSRDGKPMMDIISSGVVGAKSFLLEDKQKTKFVDFVLNKKFETKKPTVFFELIDDDFFITSNINIQLYTNDMRKTKNIKANEKIKIDKSLVYKVGPTQFKIIQAIKNGKLKTVSASKNEVQKKYQLNALVFDISYKDIKKELSVFGKGGSSKPLPRQFKLGDEKVSIAWGSKEFELPFYILLNDFILDRYPGSNAPSSYMSKVKVYDKKDETAFEYDIFMNNVLDYKGYRFFQSSYKLDESATILSVNKDPGKVITYVGYSLLFLGLILSLFVANGRFKKLSQKQYDLEKIKKEYYSKKALASIFIVFTTLFFPFEKAMANDNKILNINKEFANKFGEILIQDYQGRIKPINSLSIEIMNKILRNNSYKNLNANQLFLSMMLYPNEWKDEKLFKIKHLKLKRVLQVDPKTSKIKFNDIFTKNGSYKLENFLEISNAKKASLRDKFDKELIKLDEKLNIAYALFNGDFFKAFPLKEHSNNKWINLNEANNIYHDKKIQDFIRQIYFTILNDIKKDDFVKSSNLIKEVKNYQTENSNLNLPSEFKIKAEIFFNSFNIFEKLTPFYLLLGFLLLVVVFINIFKPKYKFKKLSKIAFYLLLIAFLFHTFGIALRWYIAGHAPWSNGYETMIYVAWAIILAGIFFSKQSKLAQATTTILSGITLFVAHLSWMDPQITSLVPVLKSYWLTIHVSVITASYGFLALSSLLGFISLILFAILNKNKENNSFFRSLLTIKEANRINMMSIFIGLVLLVIGNFLGAIWANESWGRYWGWDPKETWTLVSIIVYSIIIHLKYVKNLLSEYLFSVLSSISYASIIMTYFGVNYFLSGKHSYAAGDPIPIPDFVYISFVVFVIIAVLGFRNRKLI